MHLPVRLPLLPSPSHFPSQKQNTEIRHPETDITTLITQGFHSIAHTLLTLPLSYTPPPLSTLALSQDPMGNSIHNPSSTAHLSASLFGVRVFKGLTIVHQLLRHDDQVLEHNHNSEEEIAWKEVGKWMEGLVDEVRDLEDGERGYGRLVILYSAYLGLRIGLSSSPGKMPYP